MKKVIMFVYGDITTDARVNRAATALSQKYDVTLISSDMGKSIDKKPYNNVLVGRRKYNILIFFICIWQAYLFVKKEKPDIFYGHDYYSALLIKLLLRKKCCRRIVYDAHELYIPQKGVRFSLRSRFFYEIEKSIVSKVDLLICANEDRAEKMQEHYLLSSIPFVVRNISQLEITNNDTTNSLLASLEDFFSKPGITVVYAGAVTSNRRIDELVNNVSKNSEKYKLLIVGSGNALEQLIQLSHQNSSLVSAFTGAIPYSSLGAVLSKCDIGFIYYPTDTLNNIYCASNKLYEYASIGLPILANDNPTIKKVFVHNPLGVATNDIEKGLEQVSDSLDFFRHNCRVFSDQNMWSDEASRLLQKVDTLIDDYGTR